MADRQLIKIIFLDSLFVISIERLLITSQLMLRSSFLKKEYESFGESNSIQGLDCCRPYFH